MARFDRRLRRLILMSKKETGTFDFEKGISRLEEIVSLFDEGGLSLSEMELYFEEGMQLIIECSNRLDKTETRVTKLMNSIKDRLDVEPFEDV
jgi:exodeoxyribonuclease VII small subunit